MRGGGWKEDLRKLCMHEREKERKREGVRGRGDALILCNFSVRIKSIRVEYWLFTSFILIKGLRIIYSGLSHKC